MINHKAYYQNGKIVIVLDNGQSMAMKMMPSQYGAGMKALNRGSSVQDAFPFLTTDERKFLATGLTSDWTDVFVEE